MIRTSLSGDLGGIERLRTRLLDRGRRAQMLKRLGNQVVKASRARLTGQMGLDAPFAPRSHHDDRRKMLRKLGRYLVATVRGNEVQVSFRNGLTGANAQAQQEGSTETVTAAELIAAARRQRAQDQRHEVRRKAKRQAAAPQGDQATAVQAKRLVALGFRWPPRGTRQGARSAAWIKMNLTKEQAGLIIRKMEHRAPKASWTVTVPARPFLGATAADRKDLLAIVRGALAGR